MGKSVQVNANVAVNVLLLFWKNAMWFVTADTWWLFSCTFFNLFSETTQFITITFTFIFYLKVDVAEKTKNNTNKT